MAFSLCIKNAFYINLEKYEKVNNLVKGKLKQNKESFSLTCFPDILQTRESCEKVPLRICRKKNGVEKYTFYVFRFLVIHRRDISQEYDLEVYT